MRVKGSRGEVILDFEEMKKLTQGKYKVIQCVNCGGRGWYHVHELGIKREPVSGENLDDFYKAYCEDEHDGDCGGLGYFINFN